MDTSLRVMKYIYSVEWVYFVVECANSEQYECTAKHTDDGHQEVQDPRKRFQLKRKVR